MKVRISCCKVENIDRVKKLKVLLFFIEKNMPALVVFLHTICFLQYIIRYTCELYTNPVLSMCITQI